MRFHEIRTLGAFDRFMWALCMWALSTSISKCLFYRTCCSCFAEFFYACEKNWLSELHLASSYPKIRCKISPGGMWRSCLGSVLHEGKLSITENIFDWSLAGIKWWRRSLAVKWSGTSIFLVLDISADGQMLFTVLLSVLTPSMYLYQNNAGKKLLFWESGQWPLCSGH